MRKKLLSIMISAMILLGLVSVPVSASAASYTSDEILLAKVVQLEAGTDYVDCLAAGSVVINRLENYERWGYDTLSEVIYAKNQFSVVKSSKFKTLKPNKKCLEVARCLLKYGSQLPKGVEYFRDSGKYGKASWGSHKYYKIYGGNTFYFHNTSDYNNWKKNGISKMVIVTVGKNDTLSSIAKKYKTNTTYIKQINNLSSNKVSSGKKIIVHQNSGKMKRISYTVKSGDTLRSLAKKYNTTPLRIKQATGITSNTIKKGQKLKIPTVNY